MVEKSVTEKALEQFKAEQEERQVEKAKNAFKKSVNILSKISDLEDELVELFEDLGIKITPKLREFLMSVEKYEDLIIKNYGNGNIGIGTSSPGSNLFLCSTSSGNVTWVNPDNQVSNG